MKTILFVCVHNAGRSQMAEAFVNRRAITDCLPIRAISAGTEPGNAINPVAAEVMQEIGISLEGQHPKIITQDMVDSSYKVVTMGCGVDADTCPARIYIMEDWGLDDPKGKGIEAVRAIRDEIRQRVDALMNELQQEKDN